VERIEAAAASHRGEIWLAGGLNADGSASDETWRFDPASAAWTPGPELPDPMHHAALVSTGEELLLIGGYRGSSFSTPLATVLRLSQDGDAWVEDAPLPEARAAGAAAWDGARIVYAGGVRGGGAVSDSVLARDGERWFAMGEMSQPREHLSAASDGAGRVWLLGGRTITLDTNLATVEYVEGNLVARVAELPTPRGGAAAFYLPGVGACLAGGEQLSGAFAVVECIGDGLEAIRLPDMAGARHGHAAAIVDGAVYVMLGGPEPLLTVSDTVQRLSMPADG
jgi:N-acetylneuraminic acid mutarotase